MEPQERSIHVPTHLPCHTTKHDQLKTIWLSCIHLPHHQPSVTPCTPSVMPGHTIGHIMSPIRHAVALCSRARHAQSSKERINFASIHLRNDRLGMWGLNNWQVGQNMPTWVGPKVKHENPSNNPMTQITGAFCCKWSSQIKISRSWVWPQHFKIFPSWLQPQQSSIKAPSKAREKGERR